jgi:hypothetical protein
MPRMNAIAPPTLTAEPLWIRARAMFARAVAAIGAPAAVAAITALGKTLRRDIVAWLCPLEHIVRKLLLAEAAELRRAELARIARAPRIERVPLRGMAVHWQRGSARPPAAQSTHARVVGDDAPPEATCSKLNRACPETWRASFSFALPRNPHLVRNSRAPRVLDPWGEYPPPKKSDTHASAASSELSTSSNTRVCHSFSEDSPFRLARRFEALRRVLDDPLPHAQRLARMLAREVRRFRQVVQRYVMAPCRSNDYDRQDPRLGIDAMGAAFDAPQAFPPDSS